MLDPTDVIIRLTLAAFSGAILGWERSSKQKPAGLRTHILVTIGAAAFILAALEFDEQSRQQSVPSNADFQKVIAGVIGGVGFLGAGSIIRSGGTVHGLTTAATIWLSSAIGVACGLGYYTIAATTVVLALCVLIFLRFVENRIVPDAEPEGGTDDDSSASLTKQSKRGD